MLHNFINTPSMLRVTLIALAASTVVDVIGAKLKVSIVLRPSPSTLKNLPSREGVGQGLDLAHSNRRARGDMGFNSLPIEESLDDDGEPEGVLELDAASIDVDDVGVNDQPAGEQLAA